MKVLISIQPTENKKPTIALGIDNTNGANWYAELTPAEARVIGLQLKVLADSVDKMESPVVL